MKKLKVTFYTSILAAEEGTSTQDSFSVIVDGKNIESIAEDVVNQLTDYDFVSNENKTHFYRTSIITDFSIKELEEN